MNNRIKKSFAFLASAAMLVAGSIGSGLVTPAYANTNVSDSALVSKYPKHNVTKAELKKLQDQNWNVKTFSGKYKLKSTRSKRVNNGTTFNVDFTSGKLSGIDQAIAYCRMHEAKDPGPGTAKYTAKVSKSGKKVRIIVDMDPPQTPRANTKSGTGYQYLGLWLEFNVREEKGALRVSKVDSATGTLVTGSSATFEVRNSKNSVVATLKTGTAGTATTGKLPAGKYTVKEIGAPSGYSIDVTAGKTVTVSGDKTADVAFRDTKKLAAINIRKVFPNGSTGDTRVLGAQYTLYASSDIRNPENGSIAWKKGSVISGREGIGDTGAKTISTPDGKLSWNRLPDGRYIVRETKAPKGAELDESGHLFTITNGKIDGNSDIVQVNEETTPYHAYLLKKDENGSPLAGAKFEVKLEDDVKTQGWEKSHLYGTFVSGEDGKSNTIEIPYGRYLVKEVSAPEGYKVSKDEKPLVIDGSKETTEIEFTDEREEISLHTTATDGETETHSGVIGKKAVINDVVSYTNLIRGRKYRISGKLMDKETKQPLLVNGKEVTSSAEFTATERNSTIVMKYEFDSSALKGKTTVVYEDMYEGDKLVATHADISDEGQSVHYPEIGTQAADVSTGTNIGKPSEKTTIKDKVMYRNLISGKEYTVKGKLVVQDTKEELKDKDGNVITSERTFTAKDSDGEVEIEFTFDSSLLAGKTTVAFEDVYSNGKLVASHADISDEKQSVHFPKVQTTATDATTKTHSAITGKTSIQDVVKYFNLIPGKEYTISGKLVNQENGEVMKDSDGKEITASKAFTPENADGEVTVDFSINTSELAGKSTVAFEDVYLGDVLVAAHADINDEGQTVNIIEVHTSAKDGKTEQKVGLAEKDATVIDTVKARNLHVGEEYLVKGKLMNSDGTEVKDSKGNTVTAEKKFKATEKDMDIDITFTFDATLLSGTQTVAFEDVYSNGKLVATHSDLNDKDQTVEYPRIGTTATVDGEHKAKVSEKTTLKDVVSYKGLHAGEEYLAKGKLMNADTGKLIKINGAPVTAEARFTPKTADGTAEVEFVFNSTPLEGISTVVFEDLYQNNVHIATHSDLKDKGQTVEFTKTPVEKMPKKPVYKTPKKSSPVKTWDDTPIAVRIAGIAVGLAAAGAIIFIRKRRKENQ